MKDRESFHKLIKEGMSKFREYLSSYAFSSKFYIQQHN